MASTDFIDEVRIFVRAGNGGAGARHFHRARYIPKGGPDGGNGGHGGSIILAGSESVRTLFHIRYRKHVIAMHGQAGGGSRRAGSNGKDLIIPVPLGTVIKDAEGNILGEITQEAQRYLAAKGGQGGMGNAHFKSATNQAPHHAQPGKKGQRNTLTLELKVLADVGLVGLPNAGKSTLLSVLSTAKPKIADYPFTTLTPTLGMVCHETHTPFVMADIPGLIAGASQGKGIGFRFLRHIERTKTLLFVISADAKDIGKTYDTLQEELNAYDPKLLDKKHLVVITKTDLATEHNVKEMISTLPCHLAVVCVSAWHNKGISLLKKAVWELLSQ